MATASRLSPITSILFIRLCFTFVFHCLTASSISALERCFSDIIFGDQQYWQNSLPAGLGL